ncbi:hypothetical protein IWQ62_003494 [Dispira parvispora]|uniref:SUN domain-containing protein n=1 Tax=Dispira parvispora TaxID=1520584 RepID=A0A9W8E1L1_9FUNG|nr:hypothetical protein IWQ62_003494 [Dispira parvispora]
MTQQTPHKSPGVPFKDTSINIATAFQQAQRERPQLKPVNRADTSPTLPLGQLAPSTPLRFGMDPTHAENRPLALKPGTQRVWETPRTPGDPLGRRHATPMTRQSVKFAEGTHFEDEEQRATTGQPAASVKRQTVWRDTPNWVQRVQERDQSKRDQRPGGRSLEADPDGYLAGGRYRLRSNVKTPRRFHFNADFQPESEERGPIVRQGVGQEGGFLKDSFLEASAASSAPGIFPTHRAALALDRSGLSPDQRLEPLVDLTGEYPVENPQRGLETHRSGNPSPTTLNFATDDENIPNIMDMSPYLHSERILRSHQPQVSVPSQAWRDPAWLHSQRPPQDNDNESTAPTVVNQSEREDSVSEGQPIRAVPGPTSPHRHGSRYADNMSFAYSVGNRASDYYPQIRPPHYNMGHFLQDTYRDLHYRVRFIRRTITWPLGQCLWLVWYLFLHLLQWGVVIPAAWALGSVIRALGKLGRLLGLTSKSTELLPAQTRLLAHCSLVFLVLLTSLYRGDLLWSTVYQWSTLARTPVVKVWNQVSPSGLLQGLVPGFSLFGVTQQTPPEPVPEPLPESLPLSDSIRGMLEDTFLSIQKRLIRIEKQAEGWSKVEPELETLRQDLVKQQAQLQTHHERVEQVANQPHAEGDHTSVPHGDNSGTLSEEAQHQVEERINQALLQLQADVLGRPDYALYASGARVIPLLTSPTFEPSVDPAQGLWRSWGAKIAGTLGLGTQGINPPSVALDPDTSLGSCWPFQGDHGRLGIRLSRPIIPGAFSVEHVSPNVAIDISSAPKTVEVWAVLDHRDWRTDLDTNSLPSPLPTHLWLASYNYTPSVEHPIQTFPVDADVRDQLLSQVTQVRAVQFRVLSNHGNSQYTCLYRFRAHALSSE